MPEDMLTSAAKEQEKNTSEKTDALLPDKQDILQAFWKDKNDTQSLQKLEDILKPVKEAVDQKTADDIVKNLAKEKDWCGSLKMSFEDFTKNVSTFVDKKILNFEDISIAAMKTYLEQKKPKEEINLNNKDLNKANEDKSNILIDKWNLVESWYENKEIQFDLILSNIDKKLAAQKDTIIAQPSYQAEKTVFEKQLGAKVDDGYFVTRFALQHVGEPNAYLSQTDLWWMKKEDLIARLNDKYSVREVISLQDKTFQNNAFDGRVVGATREEITTKWWSFETVFTAAELEFFKQDSQLRNNLTGIVQWSIFPGAKDATADKPYWNGDKDNANWIPKNALQNEVSFSQWIQQNNIPNEVAASWTKYYAETYKANRNKPFNELTPAEKKWQDAFLQNLALVESMRYRNTVQETSTKAIAENLFADIASMTWKELAWASDRKLIKQAWSNDYFAMDADWNIKLQYELNGVKWDITVDKDWVVVMWPVLWQEKWYSDIIATKHKVGQILWVTKYIWSVDAIVNKPWNSLRTLSPDHVASEIRKSITRDTVASDVTKASMQTNIARQSMFDTILSKTNTPRTNDIKSNIDVSRFSDKPLIKWIDTDDFSRMMLSLYDYSKTSSKSQMESVTNTYKMLQEYLAANPWFSENKNLQKNPERIANILWKFPIDKWWDAKIMRDKQYKEEQNKASIDNELAELEKKIDNNFK